jgi:hypothetical protein
MDGLPTAAFEGGDNDLFIVGDLSNFLFILFDED